MSNIYKLHDVRLRNAGHRTPEEIQRQLEQRLAEMEAEKARIDADPMIQFPCNTCRHYSMRGTDGFRWGNTYPQYHTCVNRLVRGFQEWGVRLNPIPPLCGPEKALWQPKPSRWQRILEWLIGGSE